MSEAMGDPAEPTTAPPDLGDPPTAGEDGESRCPRCEAPDPERRFYGPCAACRDELGATMRRAQRDVTVEAYAPKMHVVPNHVATKD